MDETRANQRTDARAARFEHPTPPRKRVIAVGKRENGRWKVRTSLWRYLVSTAISQ
jgi:hypothetical protein